MKTSFIGIVTATLLLAGCGGHIHQVVKEGETPFTRSEFVHEHGKDNSLVLEISGRRYESKGFAVQKQTNLAELRKRYYGVSQKHWERIFAGLDTDHVIYSVETTAKSTEGYELSCRLAWESATKPAGVCVDQTGAEFPVRFE